MNCQEIQALVEEAVENRLSASCRRKVNLHLARCPDCRAFLAAEQTEHAAWFRALNDVSDIPPPTTPSAAFADRLAAAVVPASKRAGSITVPLWLKRAAAITLLCGGAALAAWIGGELIGEDELVSSAPVSQEQASLAPEGEEEMKPKRMAAVMSVTLALAVPPAQGSSSAEATFDSFSSEFRKSASAEAVTFLSRYRTMEESAALSSFNSTEPKGLVIIFN